MYVVAAGNVADWLAVHVAAFDRLLPLMDVGLVICCAIYLYVSQDSQVLPIFPVLLSFAFYGIAVLGTYNGPPDYASSSKDQI